MADVNVIVLTGNLTKDPELRHTPSGMAVCKMRLANNTRKKDASGEWRDHPNYFDVTAWGKLGENCAQYLARGRAITVSGRIEYREWESDQGYKRHDYEIQADSIKFGSDSGVRGDAQPAAVASSPDDFAAGVEDDIPFRNIPFLPTPSVLWRQGAKEAVMCLRGL